MLSGQKTHTARTRRYGVPGDTFQAFGVTFELIEIRRVTLSVVAYLYYYYEGFDSPQDFIRCWNILHPIKRYRPYTHVYLHQFRRIYG